MEGMRNGESWPPDLNAFWDAAAGRFSPPGGRDKIKPSCLRIHRSIQIGPCPRPGAPVPKLCQNPIYLKCLELLFEREQVPQVVDIRHFRMELMESLEPANILRKQQGTGSAGASRDHMGRGAARDGMDACRRTMDSRFPRWRRSAATNDARAAAARSTSAAAALPMAGKVI